MASIAEAQRLDSTQMESVSAFLSGTKQFGAIAKSANEKNSGILSKLSDKWSDLRGFFDKGIKGITESFYTSVKNTSTNVYDGIKKFSITTVEESKNLNKYTVKWRKRFQLFVGEKLDDIKDNLKDVGTKLSAIAAVGVGSTVGGFFGSITDSILKFFSFKNFKPGSLIKRLATFAKGNPWTAAGVVLAMVGLASIEPLLGIDEDKSLPAKFAEGFAKISAGIIGWWGNTIKTFLGFTEKSKEIREGEGRTKHFLKTGELLSTSDWINAFSATFAKRSGDVGKNIGEFIVDFIVSTLTSKQTYSIIWEFLIDAVVLSTGAAAGVLNFFAGIVEGILVALARHIGEAFDNLVVQPLANLWQTYVVDPFTTYIVDPIKNAFNWIKDLFAKISKWVMDKIDGLVPDWLNWGKEEKKETKKTEKALDAIKENTEKIKEGVTDRVESVGRWTKNLWGKKDELWAKKDDLWAKKDGIKDSFLNKMEGITPKLASLIPDFSKVDIPKSLSKIKEIPVETEKSLFDKIKEFPGKVWDWIVNKANKIKEWIMDKVNAVIRFKDNILSKVNRYISDSIDYIKNIPDMIIQWIKEKINSMKDWIKDKIPFLGSPSEGIDLTQTRGDARGIEENIYPVTTGWVNRIVQCNKESITSIKNWVTDKLTCFGLDKNQIEEKMKSVKEFIFSISGFIDRIIQWIKDKIINIKNWIKDKIPFLKKDEEKDTVLDKMKGVAESVQNSTTGFVGTINDRVKGLIEPLQESTSLIDNIIQWIKDKINFVKDWIKEKVAPILEFRDRALEFKDKLVTDVTSAINYIKAIPDNIGLWFDNKVLEVKTWIKEKVAPILEFRDKILDFKDKLVTDVTDTITYIKSIPDNIRLWFNEKIMEAKTWIKEKVAPILEFRDRALEFKDKLVTDVTDTIDYIKNIPGKISEWFKKKLLDAKIWIKEKIDPILNLKDSIIESVTDIIDYIKAIPGKILEWIKEKIKSVLSLIPGLGDVFGGKDNQMKVSQEIEDKTTYTKTMEVDVLIAKKLEIQNEPFMLGNMQNPLQARIQSELDTVRPTPPPSPVVQQVSRRSPPSRSTGGTSPSSVPMQTENNFGLSLMNTADF